jgi:eukaryotic-like serine/threonine-protein kinase
VATSEQENQGQRFGRYVLLERIGSGGMAEVFRAVAHGVEGFQRTFVLKRIRADRSSSSNFVEMFVNEARISALLNHENIVQIYDFGEVEGCYFLTMEYLRGKDLSTVLRKLYGSKAHLDAAIVAFVALQVARGLAYAHRLTLPGGEPLSIIHRDVTPSNIMLTRAGGVKLLDFGIAKTQGEFNLAENTETGVCKGKLPYLAPEQVQGKPIDKRSDVFALGVVMWEALTGRRLFLGRSDYETMQNVLERPIPPPSMLRPDVPTALDYIVIRALERDRDRRYPDAGVLADELETVTQDMRYRSDAIPRMLDGLFGEEDNSVRLTPPHLPTVDLSALPSWPSQPITRKEGRKPSVHAQPAVEAAPTTTVTTTARQRRRRKLAMLTTAAVVSLLSLLLGGLWGQTRSETRPAESAPLISSGGG